MLRYCGHKYLSTDLARDSGTRELRYRLQRFGWTGQWPAPFVGRSRVNTSNPASDGGLGMSVAEAGVAPFSSITGPAARISGFSVLSR